MFLKLTPVILYCLITLEHKALSTPKWTECYCSLYSVVSTVPDEAPFSAGTDAAGLAAPVFHPRLPACSPNAPQAVEEMDPLWNGVSLTADLAPQVRGLKEVPWGPMGEEFSLHIFCNMRKEDLTKLSFTFRVIILCNDEDRSSAAHCWVVFAEYHKRPENLRF